MTMPTCDDNREMRNAFCKRLISFLPFTPCGATIRTLIDDLARDGEQPSVTRLRVALENCRSLGVPVAEGRIGPEKHYWIADPTAKKRATAITNEVLAREERMTAAA